MGDILVIVEILDFHMMAGGFLASAIFPTDFSNITEDDFDKLYISVHGEADNIVPYGFGQIPIVSFPFRFNISKLPR